MDFSLKPGWRSHAMDDAKLQLLLDRAEISDVQLRYATGLDSRDWPLFRSCFVNEVETDFTSVFGGAPRKVSADKWTDAARRTISGLAATQHMITKQVRRRIATTGRATLTSDCARKQAFVQELFMGKRKTPPCAVA